METRNLVTESAEPPRSYSLDSVVSHLVVANEQMQSKQWWAVTGNTAPLFQKLSCVLPRLGCEEEIHTSIIALSLKKGHGSRPLGSPKGFLKSLFILLYLACSYLITG